MSDKRKIFIVDDEEVIVTSLKKLLVVSGFEVEATQKAIEAVPMIKVFKPHLILLDLLMPDLNGHEICELLNKDEGTRGIPIIIISASGHHQTIKKSYRLGVIGYFTKPYDFPKLLDEINKAITYKEGKLP